MRKNVKKKSIADEMNGLYDESKLMFLTKYPVLYLFSFIFFSFEPGPFPFACFFLTVIISFGLAISVFYFVVFVRVRSRFSQHCPLFVLPVSYFCFPLPFFVFCGCLRDDLVALVGQFDKR